MMQAILEHSCVFDGISEKKRGEYRHEEKTADAVERAVQFVLCVAAIQVTGKYATYVRCWTLEA
jgi:hypothetical protein